MKIIGQAKLLKDPRRGWVLVPLDLDTLKAQAVEQFIKHETTMSVILDMELRRPFIEKTLSQLGYLHAAVWPVFYAFYMTQGIQVETEEQKERVRNDVKRAIDFVEVGPPSPLREGPITGYNMTDLKSFANASKEETSEAIDAIIRLAAEFGMVVPSPEEYLSKHGKTEFEEDDR